MSPNFADSPENRMDVHQNARLTPRGGRRCGSARPLLTPPFIAKPEAPATCDAVEALRRQRCTQAAIAAETSLSRATVSRILRRRGLSLLSAIEPAEPRPRYERETPGEIIHIDIKSSAGSTPSDTASPATGSASPTSGQAMPRRDGKMSMSLSTTTPASPSARPSPTKSKPAPSHSWKPRSATITTSA
jgi:hypothetical protein